MEQGITIIQATPKENIYRTISAQAKSWIAMLGFAFSSPILREANTQGLSGLDEDQDYRSTLYTSGKHVPVLCTGMAADHLLEFITILPGPRLLIPPQGWHSALSLTPRLLYKSGGKGETFWAMSSLLAALCCFCAPKVWVTLQKPHYWTEICFGLTELLCFFINHNIGQQHILEHFLKTNIHYELESDSGLFWYAHELNLRTFLSVSQVC